MSHKTAYCFTCKGNVVPVKLRCPDCKHLLWEVMARVPGQDSSPTRTTKELYREIMRHHNVEKEKNVP